MNAKYALALILTLQVSLSLCEVPSPSQELLEKYNELRKKFFGRMLTALDKIKGHTAPYVESALQMEGAKEVTGFAGDVKEKPLFQAIEKFAIGLRDDAEPSFDVARQATLGWYEQYLRPYIGEYLSQFIVQAQSFLDEVLPDETN